MMTKHGVSKTMLGVVLLLLVTIAPTHAQDNPAPYIFYYSEWLHGFVVERADGSDSRVLGAALDLQGDFVDGPGWSPSGEWFAWTNAKRGAYYHLQYGPKPYILNVDGTTRVTVTDAWCAAEMAWSPTSDLLLIGGYIGDCDWQSIQPLEERATQHLALVDVPNNRIVFTVPYHYEDGGTLFNLNIRWADDGSYTAVTLYYNDERLSSIHVLYTNGQHQHYSFPEFVEILDVVPEPTRLLVIYTDYGRDAISQEITYVENLFSGLVINSYENPADARAAYGNPPPPDTYMVEPQISPNAQFEAGVHRVPYVTELATHTTTQFRPSVYIRPDDGAPPEFALWHPSSSWLFFGENLNYPGGGGSPFGVQVVAANGTIQRDIGICHPYTVCFDWLPPQVNVDALPQGQPTTVVPQPDRVLHGDIWTRQICWSDDGRYLTLSYSVDTTVYQVRDSVTGQLVDEPPTECEYSPTVSPDGRVSYDGRNLIDVETGAVILKTFSPSHAFSPDSRYVVSWAYYGSEPIEILNSTTGEVVERLPTYGTAAAFSPDGRWLAVATSWDIYVFDLMTRLSP